METTNNISRFVGKREIRKGNAMVKSVKKTTIDYKIMQAFWKLYQQKPIQKISIREIIEQVPCNRSTFYAYFTDIYDLLDQFENCLLPKSSQPGVQKMINSDSIYVSVEQCQFLYSKYKNYYEVLLENKHNTTFQPKLVNFCSEIIKQHLNYPLDKKDFDIDLLIEITSNTILTTLIFYMKRTDRPKAMEIVTLITELFNNGISEQLQWQLSLKTRQK